MSDLIRSHTELQPDSRASRRSFLKLAGIGGAVLVAAGCDSNATDPIDPGGFGRLTGTVTDADGNTPLGNVNITIEGTSRNAVTAPDGTFTIENLPARTFTVVASTNGYETDMVEVTIPTEGSATADLTLTPGGPLTLDFGDDFGALNYAFALAQLGASFYDQALASPYPGMTGAEMAVLSDIRDHKVAHREFFRAAIPQLGGTLIRGFRADLSEIAFDNAESVLTTAQTLEDLSVAAYNGAGALILNDDLLASASEIASVEARHAVAVRDLLGTDFAPADLIDETGLEQALAPTAVLAAAEPFIANEISATGL